MQTFYSGDPRLMEAPDLWTTCDAKYRDRAPCYEKAEDGTEYYGRLRKLQDVDLPMAPSEYLRRSLHMRIQFEEESIGFIRDALEIDFATDYPHMRATHPRSREIVSGLERLVPADQSWKTAWENNTARLYGMEV